jgi:hypothetical protein
LFKAAPKNLGAARSLRKLLESGLVAAETLNKRSDKENRKIFHILMGMSERRVISSSYIRPLNSVAPM